MELTRNPIRIVIIEAQGVRPFIVAVEGGK